MGDTYAAVLKSIESSQVTILDKDDSKIMVKAKSRTKEIYLQVAYYFSNGILAKYTITKN